MTFAAPMTMRQFGAVVVTPVADPEVSEVASIDHTGATFHGSPEVLTPRNARILHATWSPASATVGAESDPVALFQKTEISEALVAPATPVPVGTPTLVNP